MQSFEEPQGQDPTEPTKLSTKLAIAAGALLVLALVTFLTLNGGYVDVEQSDISQASVPTAVANR